MSSPDQDTPSPGDDETHPPLEDFDRVFESIVHGSEQMSLINRMIALQQKGNLRAIESTIQVERVLDPSCAPELADRHGALVITPQIAEAIYRAQVLGDEQMLQEWAQIAQKSGGFLLREGYGVPDMEKKIMNPDTNIIVRGGAAITHPDTFEKLPFTWVSDIQVQLSPLDPSAKPITKVPKASNRRAFYGYRRREARAIVREIHDRHSCVALIADVGIHPGMYRERGIPSAARQEAARIIRDEVNPQRKGNEITVFIAKMFRIKALKLLGNQGNQPRPLPEPISNEVSLLHHTVSSKFRAIWAWVERGENIKTQFVIGKDPIDAELQVDWDAVLMKPNV